VEAKLITNPTAKGKEEMQRAGNLVNPTDKQGISDKARK
jgi:hypothetical protein